MGERSQWGVDHQAGETSESLGRVRWDPRVELARAASLGLSSAHLSIANRSQLHHQSTTITTTTMSTIQNTDAAPAVRFKRRKIAHSKRVHAEEDVPTVSDSRTPHVEAPADVASPPKDAREEHDSVPNLKEIIRARKRTRDRLKDVARKTEVPNSELVRLEAPRDGHYTNRFVAQTGQVVDREDKQM